MKRGLPAVVLVCACGLVGKAWATPNGAMLGNTCAGCHGPAGNTKGRAIPGIAGISSTYFVAAMRGYREGTRPGVIMNRIAKGYTDDEIEAMADFFARQEYQPLPQASSAAAARLGRQLHMTNCERCHGGGGRDGKVSAILAGQPARYLQSALDDFNSGRREAPTEMKAALGELQRTHGEAAIPALVQFYAGQGK